MRGHLESSTTDGTGPNGLIRFEIGLSNVTVESEEQIISLVVLLSSDRSVVFQKINPFPVPASPRIIRIRWTTVNILNRNKMLGKYIFRDFVVLIVRLPLYSILKVVRLVETVSSCSELSGSIKDLLESCINFPILRSHEEDTPQLFSAHSFQDLNRAQDGCL